MFQDGSTRGGIGGIYKGHQGSYGPLVSALVVISVLYRLKDCISAVYSSLFDLRAQD